MRRTPISDAPLGYRPLYLQVRESVLGRLIEGSWPPGALLPSEHQLASELGVSQGTVRKALDSLAAEHLLVRRQGRGTFVAEVEEGNIVFQFFRLTPDEGERNLPESKVTNISKVTADLAARRALELMPRTFIWRIERTRYVAERATILERIVISTERFPALDRLIPLPTKNLYALYAHRFGVRVGRVEERLKAVAASARDGRALGCAKGTPLLAIERIAYSIDGSRIEWRQSRCLTDAFHYYAELR